MMFHIPNGGKRYIAEAVKLKKQGVKSGVPDICLPIPKKGYHGMYIELKVGKNKPSKNQLMWIDNLNKQGYFAITCWGYEEAIETIINYLSN